MLFYDFNAILAFDSVIHVINFVKVQLYEDFSKTRASRELESSIVHAENQSQSSRGCHVFQVELLCIGTFCPEIVRKQCYGLHVISFLSILSKITKDLFYEKFNFC